MHFGNIAIEYDPKSGKIEIHHQNDLIVPNLTLALFYGDDWLAEATGEMKFVKMVAKSDINFENNPYFGEYWCVIKEYRVNAGTESFKANLQLTVFPDKNAIYCSASLEGNGPKSNKIVGFIDCGVPTAASGWRFFHGGSPWNMPLESPTQQNITTGMSFFDPSQNAWQEPCFSKSLPNNEFLKISYLMGRFQSTAVAFVPTNRDGQRSIIRTCNLLEIPHGIKFVCGDFMEHQQYASIAGGLLVFDQDPAILTKKSFEYYMYLVNRPYVLRWFKEYPELFEYIGFCTWNTFYAAVDMEGIQDLAAENLTAKNGSDRFKYLIVDDGWQSINGLDLLQGNPTEEIKIPRGLRNFEANYKFPNGIQEVSALLKQKYGFKWVGVWHAVLGYWPGIEPNSPIGRKYAIKTNKMNGFADPEKLQGYEFWVEYYKHLRKSNIDFLKIDNQCALGQAFDGVMPLDHAIENHYLMQQGAAYGQNLQILNCMCMASDNKIYWSKSNVSRVSDDFYPGQPHLARHQITQCTYNSLWYSVFCWPDHDMFQTNSPTWDPLIKIHMVSGGPVYVADELGETKAHVINRLCFPDGRLPRLDRPAIPTNDIIFGDSKVDTACKMWNYHDLPGYGRIFYYYLANMTESMPTLTTTIALSHLGEMSREGKLVLADEYVVKDQDSGFTSTIRATDGMLTVSLEQNQAKYYSLHPLFHDMAVIGVSEVYNGTKAIDRVEFIDSIGKGNTCEMLIIMRYAGTLWIYCRKEGNPKCSVLGNMPIHCIRHPENPRLFGFQVPAQALHFTWIME
jgi:hypothetical protein